jgi:hypothetical protein
MKLARESHRRLEEFFREYMDDTKLLLPPIYLHRGRIARLVTKRLRIGAITFGRHILLSPEHVTQAGDDLIAEGWLVAHEATHVLQYEREGHVRFLYHYLLDYWRALHEGGKWHRDARMNAYQSIASERAALEAEQAYKEWSARPRRASAEK